MKMLQKHLGTDVKLLTYPAWLLVGVACSFLVSLIAFLLDWRFAVGGILFYWPFTLLVSSYQSLFYP